MTCQNQRGSVFLKFENVLFTDGWDGWDGMDGMDGMDGWDGTEYQKCPLIFFILCGYIDKVYTYLYM